MAQENPTNYASQLEVSRQAWNAEAANFDNEPDHGLQDTVVRSAWKELLRTAIPRHAMNVLDIGCGTGSLSLLLAELGHRVTGIDLSPAMLEIAKAKARASGYSIEFQVMEAAYPTFANHQYDGIVCRHVLWALPSPDEVLTRWVNLLKPGGRLCLIEGYWFTGAGLHAQTLVASLPAIMTIVRVHNLSNQADLWGHPVTDERYVILADRRSDTLDSSQR